MDEGQQIAGQEAADDSGDYGFLAYQIASAALAQIRSMMEEAMVTLKLLHAIANMTVVPDGELLVGDDRSILQLPEASSSMFPVANPINGNIGFEVVVTGQNVMCSLVGYSEFGSPSDPIKLYRDYNNSGSCTDALYNNTVWAGAGQYYTYNIGTGNWAPIPGSQGDMTETVQVPNPSPPPSTIPGTPAYVVSDPSVPLLDIDTNVSTTQRTAILKGSFPVGHVTQNLLNEDAESDATTHAISRAMAMGNYYSNYTITSSDASSNYGYADGLTLNGNCTTYEDRTTTGLATFQWQTASLHLAFSGIVTAGSLITWVINFEWQTAKSGDIRGGTWTPDPSVTQTGSFRTSSSTHNTADAAYPIMSGRQYRIASINFTVT